MALSDDAKQNLLRTVQDRKTLHRNKWPYVWQWYINLNMAAGNQWIHWNPALRRVELDLQDPDKQYLVENKIQPLLRKAIGQLLRQRYKQVCPPEANDEAAVDKAKVRTQALEHLAMSTNMDFYLKWAATWAGLTGRAFTRYMWDENLGPKKRNGTALGDISVTVVSPFSIIVPPNCLTLDEMPWIIETTTRTVEWVKETYGVEVKPDGATDAFDQFDARVLDFTSGGAFLMNQADQQTTDKDGNPIGGTVNVSMYWERPTAAHKNGRLIIVAGDQVVYPQTEEDVKEGILDHSPSGDLPYNSLPWFDTGFRFWEIGLVEMLVSPQKERNLLISMQLEGIRRAVTAGVLAPKGSLEKDAVVAEPGAITFYTPVGGGKPEPWQTQPYSPHMDRRLMEIDQTMSEIAGVHFRPPQNVRAAAAFALQQDSDNTMAEPVAENVKDFLRRDGRLKLELVKKHYTDGRMLLITGQTMRYEVMEFQRDKFGDSTFVDVQDAGQLAQDRVQRLDQVLKLLGAKDAKGEPVIDAYEARRLLDIENSENIDSQVRADITRARFENDQMDKGLGPIPVNRWDNDDVHLREHYTRMKRLDWDQLPPSSRQQYEAHALLHEQQKANKAMAAQASAGPGNMQRPPGGQPVQQNPVAEMAQAMIPNAAEPVRAGLQAGLTSVNNAATTR